MFHAICYMISTLNDIKKGLNILHEGEPYVVVEANFVRMQQRKPVNQTKLRHLMSGKVTEVSFHQNESVTEADIGKMQANYLYTNKDSGFYNYSGGTQTKFKRKIIITPLPDVNGTQDYIFNVEVL